MLAVPEAATKSPSSRDLVASLPTPVILIDAGGRPARANAAAEELLNISEAALVERGWDGVLPADSAVRAVLAEGSGAERHFAAYDVDLELIGGRRTVVDVLIAPVIDAAGWTVLTIQRRAAASLVNRHREQEGAAKAAVGVAAMLAHEIKNPLSGIRGAAQLLARDTDNELTTLICAEVDRIRTLVDSMEGFTDTRPLRARPENIHAILGHVRRIAEAGFAREVNFKEDFDPSIPPVLGDRGALIQVFMNLIKNAAEASGKNRTIHVTTAFRHCLKVAVRGASRRISVPIEICIVDDGPGAPPELAANIFDPFVTSKAGGSGLGLALVAKLVGDHGGLVEYDRQPHPPRTTFRVLLPAAEAA
jgi:two-component system nitrogen regulation sensor histidine kinase GlnL